MTATVRGGSRIFIGEGLQVLGAPFWPRGAVIGEKTPLRTRRAPLLAGGGSYLLRRALWVKRAPFRIRRAPSPAGKRTSTFLDANIDPGLKYSANGDKNWRPWRRGASFHWGGLPTPAVPLDTPLATVTSLCSLMPVLYVAVTVAALTEPVYRSQEVARVGGTVTALSPPPRSAAAPLRLPGTRR